MSQFHFDILNKEQKEFFEKLKVFNKEAILSGGTALSLQIKHRHSYDFDLFFGEELDRSLIVKARKAVKIKEVGLNTKKQINLITASDILINLVNYPFKPLFKTRPTFSLPLLSVKDIAADKAYTVGRRATWRDYVDIFFLIKNNHIDLGDISKLASRKFGPEFNERLFLEQLVYFKDMEVTKISFVEKKYSDGEIKDFLEEEVKKIKI
ncbi:MAG: nucleotidyl transferase AbiEii/AbiGii toxin family protein [Elusimicrobiota bacterium]